MKKHTRKLRDRNLPFLLGLLLLAVVGNSQTLQPVSAWGYKWNRGLFTTAFGIPKDTAVLNAEQKQYPHIAYKGENRYRWSVQQQKWVDDGASGSPVDSMAFRRDSVFIFNSDTLYYVGSIDTLYIHSIIENYTRDSVFTYHDSLIIQRDSIFIYNTTRDTAYFVGSLDTAYIKQLISSEVFTYRDSLIIRKDSVFVYSVTRDTTYFIGQVDSLNYVQRTYKSADSVYYVINGISYFSHIDEGSSPCQTGSVGGQVVWNSGLNFDISAAPFYSINCQRYTSEGGSVTLSAADATYGRFDIIAFDTLGQVVVIPGDPAENPVVPSYDPTLYWYRTTVFIPAGATEPQGVSDELIYDENVEWATATGGTITANFNSTTFAVQGSKSALVSARSNGSYLQFTSTDTLNVNNYQNLSFWLRLVGSMTNQQNVSVQFLLGNTAISNAVVATVTKTNTTGWQLIALNMGQFSFTAFNFNRVRIIFSGSSSSSLYIDVVKLQTGISSGGGGGTVTDAYQKMTDGTNTATATGNGIFKFRSANNVITFNVTDNDPTHGDNVLATFNRNNIDSLQFNQILGLQDSLDKLHIKVEDVAWSNDTMYVKFNGEWHFRYYNRAYYTNNFQGTGTEESPIDLNPTPSSATPDSVLWRGPGNILYQSPASFSGGGSGTVTSFTFTDANGFTGTVTNPTTTPTLSIDQQVASALQSGKLSAADWTTFNSKLSNITGLVSAGTNVTVTGTGTSGDPYVVNSSGGGGSTPTWQQTLTAGSTLTGANTINSDGFTQTWSNGQLTLGGTGTTSATNSFVVHNSTGSSNSLVVKDHGFVGIGTASPSYWFQSAGQGMIDNIRISKGSGGAFNYGNIAIGDSALNANTTGIFNFAIGDSALRLNTTGSYNFAIGSNALAAITTGTSNLAIGANAMIGANAGVSNNLFIGNVPQGNAGSNFGSGAQYNTIVSNAPNVNGTTGQYNTALGYGVNVAGGFNTLFGASGKTGSGSNNAFFGTSTAFSMTTGSNNTAMGSAVLGSNTTGGSNVAIGANAGRYTNVTYTNSPGTSGLSVVNNSVFIGPITRALADNSTNQYVISAENGISNGSYTIVVGDARTTKSSMAGRTAVNSNANALLSSSFSGWGQAEPASGAALDVQGTNGALKLPSLTTAERDALSLGVPLKNIAISAAGSGQTNGNYTLSFSGGGGSGATGVVTIAGGVATSVTIWSWGNGYTSAPTVSYTGAGGSAATLTATIHPRTGYKIFCTDCTANDTSTGVEQTYNGTTWKNHW